jgi:hypothetical protein
MANQYWNRLCRDRGSKTARDPYGHIDGGMMPGGSYQLCCNSGTWKATGLSLHLMPALREVWSYEPFLDYLDRWVHFGAWTQPDPYALDCDQPGAKDTDPSDGIGRFPKQHGANADEGGWDSRFADAMWARHRPGPAAAMPHIDPYGGKSADPLTITLSSPHTADAELRYTVDGSWPDEDAARYTRPFGIDATTTVRVRAFKDGLAPSAVNEARFVIEADSPEAPRDTME